MKVEKVNRDTKEILQYLTENDSRFIPSLSSRVNLIDYATKLFNFSTQFWLEDNNKVIGFSACYFNKNFCYISTISVIDSYKNKGGGKELIKAIIEKAKQDKLNEIRLEVQEQNKNVELFYFKLGFIRLKKNNLLYLKLMYE